MSALRDLVVITGAGVVSPLGHSGPELFAALVDGQSAVGPIDRFDASVFPCAVAAQVRDFKARDWVSNRKNLKLMSDAVRFGLAGIKRALADANLDTEQVDPTRLGVFVGAGTALGRTEDLIPAMRAATTDDGFDSGRFAEEGMHAINPLWLLKGLSNNVLGFSTADIDARGINQNYCNSGVGGLQAIGEAAWAIAEGRADVIVAGAADSAVNPLHFTGFGRLRALTSGTGPAAVRPFDARHDGFAPGEGAAFVVLESAAHAHARGARVLGRIAGYADLCAAHALGQGDAAVVKQTLTMAMDRAGFAQSDIDLIYAHGNGTPKFDQIEAEAISTVFGDRCPPVTSNKGQIGHAIAAAGPISLVCALEAIAQGVIPHTANVETLAHDCSQIDLVRHESRQTPVSRALVHAAGIGGQTTCIALESC